MRQYMKSFARWTDRSGGWEFPISFPPSSYSFCCPKWVCDSFCVQISQPFLKCLWEEKPTFARYSEISICLKYAFQREQKRKSGLTFFVGILSLRNSASRHNTFHGACIFTNPTPWILVFKKSKRKGYWWGQIRYFSSCVSYIFKEQSINANTINPICLRQPVSNNRTITEHLSVLSCYKTWLKTTIVFQNNYRKVKQIKIVWEIKADDWTQIQTKPVKFES